MDHTRLFDIPQSSNLRLPFSFSLKPNLPLQIVWRDHVGLLVLFIGYPFYKVHTQKPISPKCLPTWDKYLWALLIGQGGALLWLKSLEITTLIAWWCIALQRHTQEERIKHTVPKLHILSKNDWKCQVRLFFVVIFKQEQTVDLTSKHYFQIPKILKNTCPPWWRCDINITYQFPK